MSNDNLLNKEEQLDLIRTQTPKYKTVLVLSNGDRVSPWARGGTGYAGYQPLTYKEGEVTRAPEGTRGVCVYLSNDNSPHVVSEKKDANAGSYFAVHECWTIGKKNDRELGEYYPAILLGKEVWNEKPAEPVEEWRDVSDECTFQRRSNGYVSVYHGGTERILLGDKGMHLWAVQGGAVGSQDYKVESVARDNAGYPCGGFKLFKKV